MKMEFLRKEKPSDVDQISIVRILQFIVLELQSDVDLNKLKDSKNFSREVSILRKSFVYLSLKYTNENGAQISRRIGMKPHYVREIMGRLTKREEQILLGQEKVFQRKFGLERVKNWEDKIYK